jgi:ubiquinone biosynthesis protein UbiJ
MPDDDWMDAMTEEIKKAVIQSELVKVLRRFAQEIRDLRIRVKMLEHKYEALLNKEPE